jgi:negative regulator of replication initiation
MSKVIELSDEQYRAIEHAATSQGQTPSDFLARWIDELRDTRADAHYYETEDWFRHLGATEEQIAESARLAREESDSGANAHA